MAKKMDYKCRKCGEPMHLGDCEYGTKAKPIYSIGRDGSAEYRVYADHVTGPVASGFDSISEAQAWIDEQ